MNTQANTESTWPQYLIAVFLAIYFVSFLLIERLDSESLIPFVLWGLVLTCMPSRRGSFATWEKGLFATFGVFLLVMFVTWIMAGMDEDGRKLVSRYLRFLLFIPVYVLMRRHARPWMLWYGALLGAWVAGIWAILEVTRVVPDLNPDSKNPMRASGMVNAIHFGMLTLLLAGIIACGGNFFRAQGRVIFAIAIGGAVLGLTGCLLSMSRGAWLYLPVWSTLVVFTILKLRILKVPTLVGLAVAGIAVAALVLPNTLVLDKITVTWSAYQEYRDEGAIKHTADSGAGLEDYSVASRLEMWKASVMIFREHPWTGLGPGNYRDAVRNLAEQGEVRHEIVRFSHPHNEYFYFLTGSGLFGLLVLLAVYLVPLIFCIRFWRQTVDLETRALAMAGIVVVTGYLHYGVTSMLLGRTTMMSFFLISLALILGTLSRSVAQAGNSR